jgi:hypothetical protein
MGSSDVGKPEYIRLANSRIGELSSKAAVDVNILERACAEQPELYRQAAAMYAELRHWARVAKIDLDSRRAVVELEIREEAAKPDGPKVTEAKVKAMVDVDQSVLKLQTEWLELEAIAARADVLVRTFEQRRFMLDDEVDLYLGGYYNAGHRGTSGMVASENAERVRESIVRRRRVNNGATEADGA